MPEIRDAAVSSVIRNLRTLYPIFPSVAIMLRQLLDDLSAEARVEVFETLRGLILERSHIFLVPANLSFAIRVLAFDRAEETDALLIDVYDQPRTNMMVKRDVLLAMSRRRVDYWLSQQIRSFSVVTTWERRALIVASYILGDEGKHWRDRVRHELLPLMGAIADPLDGQADARDNARGDLGQLGQRLDRQGARRHHPVGRRVVDHGAVSADCRRRESERFDDGPHPARGAAGRHDEVGTRRDSSPHRVASTWGDGFIFVE